MNELEQTDHHDAHVVLDDVLAPPRPPMTAESQQRVVREIVKQAQRSRMGTPELVVVKTGDASTSYTVLGELLGIEGDGPAFKPVTSAAYPITQRLYDKYQAALPAPKVVRVDTEASYEDFMKAKRKPYVDKFAEKLVEFDGAKRSNEQDGGLAYSDEDITVLGAELETARDAAKLGGKRIPLSLGPKAEGHVVSWLDDGEIFCSVKMPGPDGQPRVITSSTPAERHVAEVLDYAQDADVDEIEVMGVLPALSQVLGGGSLVKQISRATPALLSQPEVRRGEVFVGKIAPRGDATVAAVMSLLQLVQKGDVGAKMEAAELRRAPGGEALFAAAEKGLAQAHAARSKGAI